MSKIGVGNTVMESAVCSVRSNNIYIVSSHCRFLAIPFLLELRAVMDWMWTDTTLALTSWLKMEDIYANIFCLKCWRVIEEVPFWIINNTNTQYTAYWVLCIERDFCFSLLQARSFEKCQFLIYFYIIKSLPPLLQNLRWNFKILRGLPSIPSLTWAPNKTSCTDSERFTRWQFALVSMFTLVGFGMLRS